MNKKWIIPMVAALVLVPTGTSIYYGVQYNNLQHSEQVESNSGLIKTIEELRQSVANLTTEREKLNADLNKITAENEANKALVADLKVQVTNLTAVKTEYEATHAEDTATIASLNSQIDTLNARITTYEATIAENEATIESLTTQKIQLTTQVNSLTARVNTLTEEISTWKTNYTNLSLEYDLLSDRFDALTETSHALQTEIARLNGALTSAQNTDTALVNSLLKDVFADTIIKDTFSDDSCMAGMKYLQTETLLLVYTPSTETYSILYTSTEAETNIVSVAWSENKAVITLANSDTLEVVVPGATTPQASVTFYNGESELSVVTIDKGTKVSTTDIPTFTDTADTRFAGWALTADATEFVDLSVLDITENLTLYARFEKLVEITSPSSHGYPIRIYSDDGTEYSGVYDGYDWADYLEDMKNDCFVNTYLPSSLACKFTGLQAGQELVVQLSGECIIHRTFYSTEYDYVSYPTGWSGASPRSDLTGLANEFILQDVGYLDGDMTCNGEVSVKFTCSKDGELTISQTAVVSGASVQVLQALRIDKVSQ